MEFLFIRLIVFICGIKIRTMSDRKRKAALFVNAAVIVFELYALSRTFFFMNGFFDISAFQFYTNDSNIFALVSSVLYVVSSLNGKKTGVRLRFMATSSLTLTFLVVICVLIPLEKESASYLLFDRACFFEHLVCPILSFVSFVFFEDGSALTRKDALSAVLPTAVYASIMIILNMVRVVEGPYPFLRVCEQPLYMSVIWFFVIFGGAYLISRGILFLAKRQR